MESSGRQRTSLQGPPEDLGSLKRFPRRRLTEGTVLYRVTRRAHGPWWFSSGGGRFDLEQPRGTCYLALDDLSALLEVIGPDLRFVGADFLASRVLHRLSLPEPRTLADFTSRRARGLGLTAEIHTTTPYDLPVEWAKAMDALGLGGILYMPRHDPSAEGRSVALFGTAGEESWAVGDGRSCDSPELRRRLLILCGVQILDRPRTMDLQIED